MAETMIGLDIGNDAVRAVRLSRGFRGMEIAGFEVLSMDDRAAASGALSSLFEREEWRHGTIVTSLPARDCSFHRLKLPFRDLKKVARVLPMEMERFLPPGEGESLHDFMVIGQSDESDLLGLSVPRETVRQRVELLKSAGLEAAVIDVGPLPLASRLAGREKTGETELYLHGDGPDWTMILSREGRVLAARSLLRPESSRREVLPGPVSPAGREGRETDEEAFLRQIRNTCLSLLWRGEIPALPRRAVFGGPGAKEPGLAERLSLFIDMPVESVDLASIESIPMDDSLRKNWDPFEMNLALSLAARKFRKGEGINFARDGFAPRRPHREMKKQGIRALVLVLPLLLLMGFDFYLGYARDGSRLRELKNEVSLVFRETLPQVTRVVDPLQQMKAALQEGRKKSLLRSEGEGRESVLELLREISRLAGPDFSFVIKGLTYDGETVELRGETDRFNAVDQIKAALEQSPLFKTVTIASASLLSRENRVGFDLRMDVRR